MKTIFDLPKTKNGYALYSRGDMYIIQKEEISKNDVQTRVNGDYYFNLVVYKCDTEELSGNDFIEYVDDWGEYTFSKILTTFLDKRGDEIGMRLEGFLEFGDINYNLDSINDTLDSLKDVMELIRNTYSFLKENKEK